MRNDPTATQYRDIINTIKTLFGDAAATNVTNTSNLFAIE
jgi:hypothetical protein